MANAARGRRHRATGDRVRGDLPPPYPPGTAGVPPAFGKVRAGRPRSQDRVGTPPQHRGVRSAVRRQSHRAPQGAVPDEKIPLGDIAIAYETLAREAEESGKTISEHLSHLVVHGFLHLLGYDHHMDDEAERMERMERDILARIGVADPYAACDADI